MKKPREITKKLKPIKGWAIYNTFIGEIQTKPFSTVSFDKKTVAQYFYHLESLLPGTFRIIPVLITPLTPTRSK